jgi:hypothetical protein
LSLPEFQDRRDCRFILPPSSFLLRPIDAPNPRALGRHVEKDEAVEHRLFAFVLKRPQALREMGDEVGRGRLGKN